jgi:hypothetical protein
MQNVAEQDQQREPAEQKAGTGIDRTVIRDLLTMTPGERMQMVDNDARVLEMLDRVAAQLRRQ